MTGKYLKKVHFLLLAYIHTYRVCISTYCHSTMCTNKWFQLTNKIMYWLTLWFCFFSCTTGFSLDPDDTPESSDSFTPFSLTDGVEVTSPEVFVFLLPTTGVRPGVEGTFFLLELLSDSESLSELLESDFLFKLSDV